MRVVEREREKGRRKEELNDGGKREREKRRFGK